jgi:hypothetical protein
MEDKNIIDNWKELSNSLNAVKSLPDFLVYFFRISENLKLLESTSENIKINTFETTINILNEFQHKLDYIMATCANNEWSGVFFNQSELQKYPNLKECLNLFKFFSKYGSYLRDFNDYILNYLWFYHALVFFNSMPLNNYKSIYTLTNIFIRAFYRPELFGIIDKNTFDRGISIVNNYRNSLKENKFELSKNFQTNLIPIFIDKAICLVRAKSGISVLDVIFNKNTVNLEKSITDIKGLMNFFTHYDDKEIGEFYEIGDCSCSFMGIIEFLHKWCKELDNINTGNSFIKIYQMNLDKFFLVHFPSIADFFVKSSDEKILYGNAYINNPLPTILKHKSIINTSFFLNTVLFRELEFCEKLYLNQSYNKLILSLMPQFRLAKVFKTSRELLLFIASSIISDQLSKAGIIETEVGGKIAVSGLLYILLDNLLPNLKKV